MPEPGEALSGREKEVLCLVATGATNEQIARELVISANTVKVHLRNIFAKLGVASRTEASLYAIRQGWVTVESTPGAVTEEPAVPTSEIAARPVPHWSRWLALSVTAVLLLVLVFAMTGLADRLFPTPTPTMVPVNPIIAGKRWTTHPAMPTPRSALAVVLYRDALYAIGGEGLYGASNASERFDLATSAWTALAAKPTAVADVQAAVLGSSIYVPGGRTAQGQMTALNEVYDVEQDRWSKAAPLPRPLSGYALVAFEGKLYLFGGWDGTAYRDEILCYSPETDLWEEAGRLPSPRGYGGAVAADGILLVGGVDASGPVQEMGRYSPALESVQSEPVTVTLGHAQVTILLNSRLFVLAVPDPASPPQLWQPNLSTGEWMQVERSPADPDLYPGAALVGVDTQLFFVGGGKQGEPLGRVLEFQALFVTSEPLPAPIP